MFITVCTTAYQLTLCSSNNSAQFNSSIILQSTPRSAKRCRFFKSCHQNSVSNSASFPSPPLSNLPQQFLTSLLFILPQRPSTPRSSCSRYVSRPTDVFHSVTQQFNHIYQLCRRFVSEAATVVHFTSSISSHTNCLSLPQYISQLSTVDFVQGFNHIIGLLSLHFLSFLAMCFILSHVEHQICPFHVTEVLIYFKFIKLTPYLLT